MDAHAGSDGSITTPDEGDDSASKRAWRTAASLVVSDGLACATVVILQIGEVQQLQSVMMKLVMMM
jgi:hypothetical protein